MRRWSLSSVRRVPRLVPETDEERAEWEAGKRRSELRKQRKAEQF